MKKINKFVLVLIGANILTLVSKVIFGLSIQNYSGHGTRIMLDVIHIGIWVFVFVIYLKKSSANKDE